MFSIKFILIFIFNNLNDFLFILYFIYLWYKFRLILSWSRVICLFMIKSSNLTTKNTIQQLFLINI